MADPRENSLLNILLDNSTLKYVLDKTAELNLPNWYLAAGSVSQTYWNHVHGFEPMYGIKDFDLVYFDPDISYQAEDKFIKHGDQLFYSLPIEVEIRNQARVHIWYPDHFGKSINPYSSVEDGISSWGTTLTCIGVRKEGNNYKVFAAYGLEDLFSLTIRPNKSVMTKDMYYNKAERWVETWPKLITLPW
ncbi:nucleotidyltransferase family protein [Candidatus Saccharibacteria bacterium]|nr:nucleotidyltransferase family protein [Candidatus Saccharibacteria bacterium]